MQPALLGSDFPLSLDRPFHYQQALAAGITRHRLQRLVEEGLVRRMLVGVYAAAQLPDTQLTRARAIKLVVPSGHVITDESAGWLLGADMILEPNAHLRIPPVKAFALAGHHRLRNDLVKSGSRTLLARDVVEVHGLPVTTALRTAIDLGRLRHRDRAIGALDQLLRLGAFTRAELLAEIGRFRGMRGVRQLRALAPIADGRSESPGQSTLRLRFHDGGLPIPTPQQDIYSSAGRFLGRGDLVIEELRFLAEYDGERWHGEEEAEHDATRRRAIAVDGWVVRVFTRHNVYGPRQDAIQVAREGLHEARGRLSMPAHR